MNRSQNNYGIFDEFSLYYDHMIDWNKRLAREAPFFREVFNYNKVKKVLDVACGTGHHAISFAREGLETTGVDISPRMIEKARENAGKEGVKVEFKQAGFEDLQERFKPQFDAVTCLGNSLPHLLSNKALVAGLKNMFGVLKKKGILILQLRNYETCSEDISYMPLSTWQDDEKEVLFFRMFELRGELINFTVVVFTKAEGKWDFQTFREKLRFVRAKEIIDLLIETGFKKIGLYSDFNFSPFEPEKSSDIIIVAHKRADGNEG